MRTSKTPCASAAKAFRVRSASLSVTPARAATSPTVTRPPSASAASSTFCRIACGMLRLSSFPRCGGLRFRRCLTACVQHAQEQAHPSTCSPQRGNDKQLCSKTLWVTSTPSKVPTLSVPAIIAASIITSAAALTATH